MAEKALAPTVVVTDAEVAQFHRDGFMVVRGISPPEEVEFLRGVYDRLFSGRKSLGSGAQFDLTGSKEEGEEETLPQILDPSGFAPEMRETQAWVNARHVMERLLGGELVYQGDHAILKPAGHGAVTPWHQDEAYWDPAVDHASLSVWVPLQRVEASTGCLSFVRGSHLGEVVEHQPIGGDPRVHGLEVVGPEPREGVVSVPLEAGDCTVHHQRTWHYAPANVTSSPRRAWIIMGGLAATPREEARDFAWQRAQAAAQAAAQAGS